MRFLSALLLVLFSVAAFADSEEIPEEYIKSAEVLQIRKDGETVVIAFSTRHCPHCQRFGQQIPAIRELFTKEGINARVHKLDTRDDENQIFVNEHEIQGVPTIYVFVGNEKGIKYEGNREPADLANFVKKVQTLEVKKLGSAEEIAAFKENTPALLAVFADDSANVDELIAAAKSHLNINFAYATKDVAELAPGLHMFRSDGSLSKEQDTLLEPDELSLWVRMASVLSVTPFPAGARDLFSTGIHDIVFVIDTAEGILKADWLVKLAEKLRGQVVFASLDRTDEAASHALEFFGVDASLETASVRVFNDEKRKVYKMDTPVTEESLEAWLNDLIEGKVAPHLKSQELPDDWNANAVTVLVGSNFQEVAFDQEKDVFVFFHAPWCGHCKKLSPDWDNLGEAFTEKKNIVIAKLDATSNDIDDTYGDITGFPTLRFYKAKTNEVVEYNGERTFEALQKFVNENAVQDSEEAHTEL